MPNLPTALDAQEFIEQQDAERAQLIERLVAAVLSSLTPCEEFSRRYEYEEDVPVNSDLFKLEVLGLVAEAVIQSRGLCVGDTYTTMALRVASRALDDAYWFARDASKVKLGETIKSDQHTKNANQALIGSYELMFADAIKKSAVQVLVLEDVNVLATVFDEDKAYWDAAQYNMLFRDYGGEETFEEYFGGLALHAFLRRETQETAVSRLQNGPLDDRDPALMAEAYEAVLAWKRGRGRPPKGKLGQFEAANRMLKHAGLEAASAEALKAIWQGRPKKRQGPKSTNSK